MVKEIINNPNYTKEQSQEIIETTWMDIITEKLNDNKYLLDRHSNKLYYLINEANKTLNIYNKKGYLSKKFPKYNKELIKLEYLLLTFSILISYYNIIRTKYYT